MNRALSASLAVATLVSLSACNTPQQSNAAMGGLMGGTAGAVIGSAVSGGKPGATIAGGILGAATGAMVGSASTPPNAVYAPPPPPPACASWGYDYYGNRVCRAYY